MDIHIPMPIELNVDSKAVVYLLFNNESSSVEVAPILDDCRQFMTLILKEAFPPFGCEKVLYYPCYNILSKKLMLSNAI